MTTVMATIHNNTTLRINGSLPLAEVKLGMIGTNQSAVLLAVWNKTAMSKLPFVLLYTHVKIIVKGITRNMYQKPKGAKIGQFPGW